MPIRSLTRTLAACLGRLIPLAGMVLATAAWPQTPAGVDAADGRWQKLDLLTKEQPPVIQQVIEQVIYEAIPRDYEDTRKWGTTKEVFDGWHVRADGLKISTKRKKKRVRHGTWKRYRITIVDPQQTLKVRLGNVQRHSTGAIGSTLFASARLRLEGRLQEWQRDIRLMSISASAIADVELQVTGTVTTLLDPTCIPPGIMIHPVVDEAQLRLVSFKLERISKADGPLVRELVGDGMEPLLEEYLLKGNVELADRLNRQIAKKQAQLRFSLSDPIHRAWQQWGQAGDRPAGSP